jgi:hypothetical protein
VAKPVMESELLDTLALHLQLKWRHQPVDRLHDALEDAEALLPGLTGMAASAEEGRSDDDATPTAHAWLCRLRQQARLGDLNGLQGTMDEPALQALPELQSALPQWRTLVDDLDFDGLIQALRAHPASADPDEAVEEADDVSNG